MKEFIERARSMLLGYRQTREKYVRSLARLPDGKLKADDRNGVKYYYYSVGGRQVYLGRKHPELVKALKERRFAEEAIAVIDKNERCLENLIENLESAAPENILKKMPKSYMPEDGESVLCCSDDERMMIGVLHKDYYIDFGIAVAENYNQIMHDVIAWRPLPAPYRPERREGK